LFIFGEMFKMKRTAPDTLLSLIFCSGYILLLVDIDETYSMDENVAILVFISLFVILQIFGIYRFHPELSLKDKLQKLLEIGIEKEFISVLLITTLSIIGMVRFFYTEFYLLAALFTAQSFVFFFFGLKALRR